MTHGKLCPSMDLWFTICSQCAPSYKILNVLVLCEVILAWLYSEFQENEKNKIRLWNLAAGVRRPFMKQERTEQQVVAGHSPPMLKLYRHRHSAQLPVWTVPGRKMTSRVCCVPNRESKTRAKACAWPWWPLKVLSWAGRSVLCWILLV